MFSGKDTPAGEKDTSPLGSVVLDEGPRNPWQNLDLAMVSVGVGDARASGSTLGSRANETLSWLAAASGFDLAGERKVAALANVASVYADLCAPRGASQRVHDLVARFTLLFFLVDDASEGELPDLLASDARWSIGRYTDALRAWLADFPEREAGHPRLRQRFAHAYHDYLAARRAEHGQGARVLSLEEHWDFRRRTIFMEPYLDLWLLLLSVDLDALAEAPFAEARGLAVDLVLLANDLASAERDAKGGASPDDLNLIHTYARVHAESEGAAVERLVAHYNGLIERYRAATARALAERPGPHAESYVEILHGVVDGNVASVRALASRYPGSEPVMRRLLCCRAS
jgi:hypothetical protein